MAELRRRGRRPFTGGDRTSQPAEDRGGPAPASGASAPGASGRGYPTAAEELASRAAPAGPAQGDERVVRGSLDGADLRLGLVCSRFNGQITTRLLTGARRQLELREVPESSTTIAWVPGVFELPLAARALVLHGAVDAVVCLGAAIRGDTSQHDHVAGAVAKACQTVQLESGVPVAFGVVTTDDLQQALELSGGRYGNRGSEAVDTAIEMASLLRFLVPAGPMTRPARGRATGRGSAGEAPVVGGEAPAGPR